jgi:serine/threonine-protein kinase RsbW
MEYKIKIPCSKDRLSEVREFLSKVLADHQVPEFESNTLVLAVDEVCANLIIHSHQCNPKDNIELKVKVRDGSEITFEITDKGIGFNIGEYKEPSLADIVRQKRKGGIGLMLVKRIMDEIELVKGKKANVYRLVKKF